MPDPTKYFFLLGGYDLEMVEIRKLLKQRGYAVGVDFADLRLAWNEAQLSRYAKVFHPSRINVGIELAEDIPPPPNYHRVDHHNEFANKPSSLEQVAALIGVELNRKQRLAAVNDRLYIPGLIAAGATGKEINDIRRRDRKAQGATKRDEVLAQTSIDQHLTQVPGATLVKALTPHFSAISDRLFGLFPLPWIIYSDTELVFYGPGSDRLAAHFADWIRAGKAYAGGGPSGYFGLAENAFTPQEIHTLPDRILHFLAQSTTTHE